MSQPRVAYILLWFPEPSQTFVLDEVNTLTRLGLDVEVFTLYGPRHPKLLAGMALPLAPITHLGTASLGLLLQELARLRRRWGPQAAPLLRRVLLRRWRSLETAGEACWAAMAAPYLARRFLAAGISHIHAPWANGPATAAWVASRLSGIPFSFCGHAHDLYPPDGALLEKLAAAAWMRTISAANQRYLTAMAPGSAGKIFKIPIGIPLEGAGQAPASRPQGAPYRVLGLGRLVAKKGFSTLIAACRLLQDQGFDFRLTLAGDGPQRAQLSQLIRQLGVDSRVSLVGFVPHREVPRLLGGADLFIMPSVITPSGDRDGIPTVILEALAQELPVVATEVSGIPEVIRSPETGWLVPAADPEALAQAVREASANPAEARRRALAGRELVAREFDSVRNYTRLKELFVGLIG